MKNIMLFFFTALFVAGLFFTTQAYSATCGFQLEGRNTDNSSIKFDIHIRKYQANAAGLVAVEPGPWVKLQTYTISGGDEFARTVTTTLCSNSNASAYEIKLTRRYGSSGDADYNQTDNKRVLTTRYVFPTSDNSNVLYVGDLLYYVDSAESEGNM